MASILTGHVTHWACLGCSVSAYTTACSSSWQYPATSLHNIPQATINNLINSMWRRCVALREAYGGHTRYWLVFGPPKYSKTHFRVAFYCGQPKAHLWNYVSGYSCTHVPREGTRRCVLVDTLGNAVCVTGTWSMCKTTPILLVHMARDIIGRNRKYKKGTCWIRHQLSLSEET